MEQRIKFYKGQQRKFLDLVVNRLGCVSIRGILQFGFDINYNSFKNYYSERRLIPINLFEELCHVAKIDKKELKFEIIEGNWGQVKGGRIGRR
ncbi:MAG: hypothetical protein PHF67_05170 [Candidatus Nanoarchaeia archaeon]|nr:hypothetical protein [Candidatus Nanoarchaeia archaeon]